MLIKKKNLQSFLVNVNKGFFSINMDRSYCLLILIKIIIYMLLII